jgi:hypothetical protein
MKRIVMMLFLLGWIHEAPLRCTEKTIEAEDLPTLADKLEQAKSVEEMDRLARSAAEQRDLFVGRLIVLLRTSNLVDAKVRACYLLGEFKAERAVFEVIKNIGLTVERGDTDKIPLWSRHPCVDALSHIGKPAERVLIRFIASNEKKDLQALALDALVYINGFKRTPSILEDALQDASGLEATRLRQALEELKHR